MSTPFLLSLHQSFSFSCHTVIHYSQIQCTPTNVTVCLLFRIQFYTPNVTVTSGIERAICLWWKYLLHHNMSLMTIPLNRHNTLTFPHKITDFGEVTLGPTRNLPPGPASIWLVVPRRTWVGLVCATQRRVVLCRYSEHCPNVGHLSILRKCLVRPLSPKRDGGGHTSENRGVETYAYMHITYILPNASRQRVSRNTILSKNVKSPKDGSNPKLPYKGVESRWYNWIVVTRQ